MPWRRASPLLALAAAACMQLVLLAPAGSAQVVLPDACRQVHGYDFGREEPILMNSGTIASFCPDDITTGCKERCRRAVQRVRHCFCSCAASAVCAQFYHMRGSTSVFLSSCGLAQLATSV
jgi:hypothetical protein